MNKSDFSYRTTIYKNNTYYKEFDIPWQLCADLFIGDLVGHSSIDTGYKIVLSFSDRELHISDKFENYKVGPI